MIGGFNGVEPLRLPVLARRFPPNRVNLPEPVSASAMLGPLPCSNRKNREKPSFGPSEQEPNSAEQGYIPHVQGFGCQSGPLCELANDLERCAAAVRPSGVAGEFLVGHVRVVLEWPGRVYDINTRDCAASGEFRRDFSGKSCTIRNGSEVDV